MKIKKLFLYSLGILILAAVITCVFFCKRTSKELISLFPIEHYSQTISTWINPNDPNYNKPIMQADAQQKSFDRFFNHYYGAMSPWDINYVNKILGFHAPDDLSSIEKNVIATFTNKDKPENEIGYGENFRPYPSSWIQAITDNINLSQFTGLKYNPNNHAIAIENLHARTLPTDDVYFYSHKIAGQGYPFDNLQISALWAGTPVYILGQTRDHAWSMVLTPDYIGWVKSNGLARTSAAFMTSWKLAAQNQLAAITKTQTSMVNQEGIYRFSAYVGSVFPSEKVGNDFRLMVPAVDASQQAIIDYAVVPATHATTMPVATTPHNFAAIINTLAGRQYGWGNMYFYNDCSGEMKSLFTPFGIWLPRHSSEQINVGKVVDMSSQTAEQRLNYLMGHGQRLMTLVYIGGHIVLYVGNFPNPNSKNHETMAMLYEDMWGLSPHPSIRRSVIGQSVFFPMLLKFPEDASLVSQAGKSYFQVSFLNEPINYLNLIQQVDLKMLMYP